MVQNNYHILEINIDLYFPNSHSLKEKRAITKSLIKRLQNQFNISIAETDGHETWQRTIITLAMVNNDMQLLTSTRQKIEEFIYQILLGKDEILKIEHQFLK